MKKKIILMVSTLVCMLSLCSCGKNSMADELNGLSETDLQSACEQTAGILENLSAEESAEYYAYYLSQEDGKIYADLMEQWIEIEPQIGDFVGYKDFEMTTAGKTITATETITYTNRDIKLIYVIDANSMEATAVNVEIVYSMGETMAKAGLNTIMAISIVFCILILISLVIYCFNIIPVIQDKLSKKDSAPQTAVAVAPVSAGDEAATDDTELIAVIAAAIAASTGTTTDDFVVRSIKRRY